MNILLDTHAFIWFGQADSRLSTTAMQAFQNVRNQIRVSVATCWEMAIKAGLRKLDLKMTASEFVHVSLKNSDITLLDITLDHVVAVEDLPLHHRDPFDRLIIVQARINGWPIISCDELLDAYGVTRIW